MYFLTGIDPTTGDKIVVTTDSVENKDGAAGTVRAIDFSTDGVLRAQIGLTATAETGSNTGSDVAIIVFADDGVTQTGQLLIDRASGNVTISGNLTVTGTVTQLTPA